MPQRDTPSDLFLQAVLTRVDTFTEGVGRFRFALEEPFDFIPGQYATLAFEREGKLVQRPYSICSSPFENEIEFYCDLVPGGAVSPLFWEMEAGTRVRIRRRAAGRFTLEEAPGVRRHLMLATVTGAGPFISMIRARRDLLARGGEPPGTQMVLLHGCSRSDELGAYLRELGDLAESPWFHYVPTVSRPWEDRGWSGETGRVEDVVRKHADRLGLSPRDTVAYACGNPTMIENVRGVLERAGYPGERVKEEKYY